MGQYSTTYVRYKVLSIMNSYFKPVSEYSKEECAPEDSIIHMLDTINSKEELPFKDYGIEPLLNKVSVLSKEEIELRDKHPEYLA